MQKPQIPIPENTNKVEALHIALQQSEARFRARTPNSAAAIESASQVMPSGLTRNVLQSSPYPVVMAHAEGSRMRCVDGHEYLDYVGDYTAGLYGHSHPQILAAIQRQLKQGLSYGAAHEHEAELARLLVERFPSLDTVQFANSGTEANLGAIKTARAYTGRDAILVMEGGYHGGVLSFGSGNHRDNAPYDFIIGQFNDWEATLAALGNRQTELAAILVEPIMGSGGGIIADMDFLQHLRHLADETGALLIFDEVMTSRHSAGGMQSRLGIIPDLTSLGKYIGGGFAFGCFGGREEVMAVYNDDRQPAHAHNGTFNNHVLTTAVASVCLREIFTPDIADRLFERGETLRNRLRDSAKAQGVSVQLNGMGSVIGIHFCQSPIHRLTDINQVRPETRALLYFEMLARGIYMIRRGAAVLSLPLSEADEDTFVDVFTDVLACHGDVLSA